MRRVVSRLVQANTINVICSCMQIWILCCIIQCNLKLPNNLIVLIENASIRDAGKGAFDITIPCSEYSKCVMLCTGFVADLCDEYCCAVLVMASYKTKTKLHGPSPRANYTDRATVACRRSDCQRLRIEGAMWSAWRIPTAVFSVF
jgi:hypothetical protein